MQTVKKSEIPEGWQRHLIQDDYEAEAVMLQMLPEPCLPVHDSFIVRKGQAQKLRRVMNE